MNNKLGIILQYYVLTAKNSTLRPSFLLYIDTEWNIKTDFFVKGIRVKCYMISGNFYIIYEYSQRMAGGILLCSTINSTFSILNIL